jgi:hypothetical protein
LENAMGNNVLLFQQVNPAKTGNGNP